MKYVVKLLQIVYDVPSPSKRLEIEYRLKTSIK